MAGIFGVLFPPLLFIKVAWTEAPVAVHLPSADKYVHAGMEKLPICQQLFFSLTGHRQIVSCRPSWRREPLPMISKYKCYAKQMCFLLGTTHN